MPDTTPFEAGKIAGMDDDTAASYAVAVEEQEARHEAAQLAKYRDAIVAAIAAVDAEDDSMFYVGNFTIRESGVPVLAVEWTEDHYVDESPS